MLTARKLQYYSKGVTYGKTQAHLKPYIPHSKKSEDEYSLSKSSDMWSLKSDQKV